MPFFARFVVEYENLWGFVLFVLVQPLMAETPLKCLFCKVFVSVIVQFTECYGVRSSV